MHNDLNRYALGTCNQNMKYGANRSLTIDIQADSPGADKEANWQPAPAGAAFSMMLRNYWPDADGANRNWTPPAVHRLQ